MERFLFLGAGSPWIGACAEALAHLGHAVTAVSLNDWRNGRGKPPEERATAGAGSWRRVWWAMPPGYAGSLRTLFAPWLRSKLRRELAALGRCGDQNTAGSPWVVVPYPWFEAFTSGVPDGRLIYFHYDDYVLFRPERQASILGQQRRLVGRAVLTLCSSRQQTEVLRARYPARAERIRHFPHGVVERFINPAAEVVPEGRVVGYVGNLIDRVDWRLVGEVARALPDTRFIFVGGLGGANGGGNRPDWQRERADSLALPNVEHVGPVPQDEVNEFYWQFSVFWIPYATDHTFNQASCPTKVMDGLASGRPMVSTGVPECRLYPEWITVADTPEDMVEGIRRALAEAVSASRTLAQLEFAQLHTWTEQAKVFTGWLEGLSHKAFSTKELCRTSTLD